MGQKLLDSLHGLISFPSSDRANQVMGGSEYDLLSKEIVHCVEGTQCQMTVAYLQDVSSLLALVSAVCERDFERYMQAERQMIKHCLAFDHVNYARYLSYQHAYLRDLEQRKHLAFNDLKLRGFGGSFSGGKFSNVHGDIITEVFNGETKRNAGPFRRGYSTNTENVDTCIKTTHIHTKVQSALREKINLCTSSVHKKLTRSGMNMHTNHVRALKEKLTSYKLDPFEDGPARHTQTGIDEEIIKGLQKAWGIQSTWSLSSTGS